MKSRVFALVLIAFCCYSVSAQNNITKTAGVNYTSGVPTFNPSQKTGSEYAIDTTNGRFYQLHRTSPTSGYWLLLGQGIDTIGSHGAPTYAPTRNISWFAVNIGDSLYRYSGSGFLWNCLNCGGGGGGGTANNGVSDNEAGGIFRLGNRYMASPDAPFTMDRSLNVDGRVWFIGDLSDSTLLVVEGATDRVGIGTPAPGFKLDVVGDVRINQPSAYYLENTKMAYGKPSNNNYYFGGAGNVSGNATKNIGIGLNALLNLGATGGLNTAIGFEALKQTTTGQGNVAIGPQALSANTTGNNNFAIGTEVLKVATASKNTAIGALSMQQTTTGDNNCAVGYFTLNANTIGVSNTAVGNSGMQNNIDGISNTAIGESALFSNSTGDRNVSIGRESLYASTGDDNIAVGRQAGVNLTSGNRNILIGASIHAPSSTGSNQISIGNIIYATGADGSGLTVSSGKVGIKTNAPSQDFHVSGNARVTGAFYDSNNDPGTGSQILSSTVTGTDWVAAPAAPTVLTLNNGLTLTGTNGQWGGPLVQVTTIDQDGFYYLHKDGRKVFYRYNTGNPVTDQNVTGTVDITGKGLAPSMNTAPSEDNILTIRGHDGTSTYYANALFMGVYPTATDGTWIQSRSESAYTTKYLLNINPRGGKVAIGRDPESDDPDAHVTISQAVTGSTITGILLHLENGEGNKAAMSFGVGTDQIKGEAGFYDNADAMRIGNRNTQTTSSIRFAIGGETADKVVMIPAGTGFGTAVTTNIKSTIQDEGSLGLKTTTAPSGDLTLNETHCVVMKNSGAAGCTYTLPDPDAVVGRWYWIMNHSSQTITLSRNVTTATGGVVFNTIAAGEWAMMTAFNGNGWRGHKQVSL